ncbi:MAG TPA: MFS transporter [Sphingomonas sp.]
MLIDRVGRAGQDGRFLLLFAFANAGGVVAYLPLLTLLLPAKVAMLAGEARVEWLSATTMAGAITASVANIGFGWLSDVMGTRRTWAGAGLFLTVASFATLHLAASPSELLMAVVLFQLSLNMLLAPLSAWGADRVPAHRLGLLGGLLAAGTPIGALAGVVATLPALGEEWMRLGAVGAFTVMLAFPLLLARLPAGAAHTTPAGPPDSSARADFLLLLLARFLSQIAGAVLFGYLFYYFQSLPGTPSGADVAQWSAASLTLAFPVALLFGRLSDRLRARKPFLVIAASGAALGLALMATRTELALAIGGYVLFGCANAVFLALLSGHAFRLLPSHGRRGRDLGVLNLGNTVPSVVAPLLAIGMVPGRGFGPLLAALTTAMLLAGGCVIFVSGRQGPP